MGSRGDAIYPKLSASVWHTNTHDLSLNLTLGQDGGAVLLVTRVDHGGVESGLPVGVVLDGAHVAVGLHQRVLAADGIAIALLLLVLVVTGVGIVHSILEGVLRVSVL